MSTAFWLNFLLIFTYVATSIPTDQCSCNDVCGEEKKELLGQGTWRLLHEMVDNVEQNDLNEELFKNFILSLQYLYPCAECRKHIQEMNLHREEIYMTPQFMCEFHNRVNKQLNKAQFDCN